MKLTLYTERLILRPWTMDDAETMFSSWASDPEVSKYLTWKPHNNVEETKLLLAYWIEQYEKPERLNFAIELKEDHTLIGGIDVVGYLGGPNGTPVLGYNLAKKYWNKGYMTEVCKCLLEYLFSIGHKEVRIDAMVEKVASQRVIQKCGGTYIGQETSKDGKLVNCYIVKK